MLEWSEYEYQYIHLCLIIYLLSQKALPRGGALANLIHKHEYKEISH